MLPQRYRLPLQSGRRMPGQTRSLKHCLLVICSAKLTHPRFAVIIPNSVLKLAHDRNRLRRQLHGLFIHQAHSLPALDILLIARSGDSVAILKDFSVFLHSPLHNL